MMKQTVTDRSRRLLVAGALLLAGQGALSGEPEVSNAAPEELTVTAPRPEAVIRTTDMDVAALIEAMNREMAKDLKETLKAMEPSRIELAISEVATRG